MHPNPDLNPQVVPEMASRQTIDASVNAASGHAATAAGSGSEPLIALVGSANSGKTTLFNRLTGSHYNTINYPGATVEFAIGTGRSILGFPCRVMDTPGLTSLIPASLDEKVTVDALFARHRPDVVVAVVDANQLSRHLYLVKQLQDLGFNLIVALTMTDLLRRRGRGVDARKLSELLECPVVALDPRKKDKVSELGRLVEERWMAGRAVSGRRLADLNAYGAFAESMTEERVHGIYAGLDELERLVTVDDAGRGKSEERSTTADRILLHPVYGLGIFLLAMFVIFTSIFWIATPFMDLIDGGFGWIIDSLKGVLPQSWIVDLVADGIIGGLGSVMVFLPQIVILFFAMGYLEDSGYLARGAALVDKPLSKIGLNGKSFVPLLSGYACAIPAMMAARTIPNRYERNLTIFIIPLMSCSARLPVYTLLLAFITPREKPWIGGLALTGLYLGGLVLGAIVSTLISKFKKNKEISGFILELPALRAPVLRVVVASTYHKAEQYLRKAGGIIVAISVGLWILTHTPTVDSLRTEPASAVTSSPGTGPTVAGPTSVESSGQEYVSVSQSYAAMVGRFLEPITRPMGLDWRGGVAMICGFAAREVFVSAMALMYRLDDSEGDGLADRLLASMSNVTFDDSGKRVFTLSSVLGMILFFMIALQCFPTVAVAKAETRSWKLAGIQLVAYTGVAYVLAVALVQGLRAIGVA
ncbi:MAG: ferrous iron transporter B [Fibrobacterota bacterium]|nr:ferrous iron transporter B [Fibrobacterota bacterium]